MSQILCTVLLIYCSVSDEPILMKKELSGISVRKRKLDHKHYGKAGTFRKKIWCTIVRGYEFFKTRFKYFGREDLLHQWKYFKGD